MSNFFKDFMGNGNASQK